MKITKDIIKNYIKKLNIGNGRSIYLNSHVGKSATRIDLFSIDQVSNKFSFNFLNQLLNQSDFKIKFEIGGDENFYYFKNLDKNLESSEEKSRKLFDSLCLKINKKFDELVDRTIDIYNETGIHNFGFGYPMIGKKLDGKYIYAPLFIWNLELRKIGKNKYEISKQADFDGQINNSLLNYIENNNQIKIEYEQKNITEETLKEDLLNFFKSFNKKKYEIGDIYDIISQPNDQTDFYNQFNNEYNLFIDGVFGIYALQKETIKVSTEELLNNFDEIINDDNSDRKLEYIHSFGATDLDPSQARILNTLSNDTGDLIIQGPPGTGKSQTITSILTNALQNNQKCLVVCEKKTALEILKKNLENLGLGESFVLIEEADKDRSSIVRRVNNYEKNMGSTGPSDSIDFRLKLSEINSLVSNINDFHKNLNKDIFDGISWNKIAGMILSLQDEIKNSKVQKSLKNYLDTRELDKDVFYELNGLILKCYDKYDNYGVKFETLVKKFYEGANNNLKDGFNGFIKTQQRTKDYIEDILNVVGEIKDDKDTFDELFKNYKANIAKLIFEYETKFNTELDSVKDLLNQGNITILNGCNKKFSDIKKQIDILSKIKLNDSKIIDDSMDKINIVNDQIIYKLSEIFGNIEKIENIRRDLENRKQTILRKVEEGKNIYGFDFMDKGRSSFLGSFKAVNKFANEIIGEFDEYYSIYCSNYNNIPLSDCFKFDNILSVVTFLNSELLNKPYFSKIDQGDLLLELKALFEKINLGNNKLDDLYAKINDIAIALDLSIKPFDNTSNIFESIEILNEKFVLVDIDYKLFSKINKRSTFYDGLDSEEQKFISIFFDVESQYWKNYFVYGFFKSLLDNNTESAMSVDIDDSIEKLDDLLGKFKKSQVKKIEYLLWNRKKKALSEFSSNEGTFKSVFAIRAIPGVGKRSLKQIINADFNFFTNFFPIILTNPSCCAQLFEMKKNLFDIVIFDEASQLKIEDSFQCLIRGKRKIICGDENQMPPSDYFASNAYISGQSIVYKDTYTEDEDFVQTKKTLTFTNCESLLEFAELSEYKSEMLKIHYRSYHPYLIDFSNEAFYAGELHPFPSKIDYAPMRFIPIEGSYSKKRGVNEEEANYVIEVLRESLEFYGLDDFPSIGIATFNMKQRKLILDKISELQKGKDLFAKQLNNLNPKNFFIKNLDSIQGDERDIIIVSTTFGVDKYDGRFIQNFGPINTEKGFRFLNVMITRARKKIVVISSIPETYYNSYEEELKNQEGAYGKAGLYAWLAYVRSISNKNWEERNHIINILKTYHSGYNATNESQIYEISETPFEDKICEEIEKNFPDINIIKGKYEAGLKIDIALELKNGKKIAIECDGNNINSENEAYVWDIYRKKWIKEKCGYDDFYRVWTIDWINNKAVEVRKLLNFLALKTSS